jgi:choloylglycine hydrolase
VDLTKFNLAPGAPVMELNPDDIALAGNVLTKFQLAKAPF